MDDIIENCKQSREDLNVDIEESDETRQEKLKEVERLEEEWGESKPEAADRPDKGDAFTNKELKEKYDETIKEIEEKEKEKYYPAGQ
jgi:hypothetical protein